MASQRQHLILVSVLTGALLLLAVFIVGVIASGSGGAPETAPVALTPGTEYLAATPPPPGQFRASDIPRWLLVHVAVIAGLQLLAVIVAAKRTRAPKLSTGDRHGIQFLCEVPMYLGLFGTLLGVCLTQFITGSLVAPLAYLTTMSGIVLHLIAKLTIWLPVASNEAQED